MTTYPHKHPLESLCELYRDLREQWIDYANAEQSAQKMGDEIAAARSHGKRMDVEQIWDMALVTVPEHDLDAVGTMLGVHDARILALPDEFGDGIKDYL
jgi:hypothetical protein